MNRTCSFPTIGFPITYIYDHEETGTTLEDTHSDDAWGSLGSIIGEIWME